MDFQVLGPVGACAQGHEVSIGGPRQRRLLAALLISDGHVVSVDRLVDAVWGDERTPPEGAGRTVLSYVSRLRSVLGDGSVVSRDGGYVLIRAEAVIDADRFTGLVAEAGSQPPGRALGTLNEALALWRGRAFGELADEDWARPSAARLEELRLVALEARCQARLDLGAHAEAVPELDELVAAHPLRERFRAQLMLALYRCGRQAESLRAYQDHRAYLAEETGLEPSRDLVELERRIALADPSLAFVTVGRTKRGYVLADAIGEGAFGTVYRAVQPSVGREVAVKVVKAELADDPAYVRRFETEARLVARLEHPHIVPLYDFWREPGGAYLVFRHLRGGTAAEVAGPWPLERVDRLVTEIGWALASAHAAGVVHRDVKPANVLFDEEGSAYLADFGIALEGPGSDLAGSLRSAGSPLYASPEQVRDGVATERSDQYAFGVVLWEMLAGVPPFEGDRITTLLRTKLERPVPPLGDRRPDVPDAVGAVLQRATAVHPDDRYASMTDVVTAWAAAMARPARAASTTGELPAAAPPGASTETRRRLGLEVTNPYKGLRAFDEADAADFFGRAADAGGLAAMVAQHRFVAVVGPSGAGKSSLVRAALVPRLRTAGSLVAVAVPGSRPVDEVAESLLQLATSTPPLLRERLAEPGGLGAVVDEILDDNGAADDGADGELVLVIDQFEELWTLADAETRDRFLDTLADAAGRAGRLRIVVTLRADFFDRPLAHPAIGPLTRQATFAVTPLDAAELEQAITAPAARVGVRLEPGLVAELVADVASLPAALPLLQYALTELFDRRDGATMTVAAYREIHSLSGALATRAEVLTSSLSEADQTAVRRLFARLVTPGDGTEDTRRRTRRAELTAVPAAVIDAFGAARLLTFDVDPHDREPTVEVAHEALLRHWSRLRAWLDEDRDGLRTHRHLTEASAAWSARGREPGDLYRGSRLTSATDWSQHRYDDLTPLEATFLATSRQRARRGRRLSRTAVSALAVLAVAAVTTASLAITQRRRADRNATSALANAGLAQQKAGEASTNAQAAEAARIESDLRRLAFESQTVAAVQPDLAMLLAVEAHRRKPGVDGDGALMAALTARPGIRRFVDLGLPAGHTQNHAAIGGGVLAVESDGKGEATIALFDASTLEPTGVRLNVGSRSQVAIRADGAEIATISIGGGLRRWDPGTGRQLGDTIATSVAVSTFTAWPVNYLPDGSIAAADDLTIAFYPPGRSERSATVRFPQPVRSMAVSPSGRTIAVGIGDVFGQHAALELLDTATLQVRTVPNAFYVFPAFGDEHRLFMASFPATFDAEVEIIDVDRAAVVAGPVPLPTMPSQIVPRADGGALVNLVSGGYVTIDSHLNVGTRFELTGQRVMAMLPTSEIAMISSGKLVAVDPELRTAIAHEASSGGRRLVGQVAVDARGTRLLVVGPDDVRIYDTSTMTPVGPPLAPTITPLRGFMSLSPDGSLVGVSDLTQTQVIGAATGRPSWTVKGGGLNPPTFSPDSHRVAIGGLDSVVRVLDAATGAERWSLDLHVGNVASGPEWSADGRLLALAANGLTGPVVLDAETGRTVSGPYDGTQLSIGPDSRTGLLFGAELQLVDVMTGQVTRTLHGYANRAGGSISPDGRTIFAATLSGLLELIDMATEARIGNPIRLTRDFLSDSATTGGTPTGIYVGTRSGPVLFYDGDPTVWARTACEAAGRNLTREEWTTYLGSLGPYAATCSQYPAAP